MPDIIRNIFTVAFLAAATFLVSRAIIILVDFLITTYIENRTQEEQQARLRPLLAFINFGIWVAAILFLLDNLGFEIATIIAGLGVGGVAIALASQGLLGDLFSYFIIYFDKPFSIGDFIIFDDKLGVVEKIGVKSTRIRALSGEQLIVSNSNLLNARVHNYKRMERRRVLFQIGVVYGTSSEKLEYIPGKIKEIIEGIEGTEFDRSHFFRYGAYSLDFETVYYINTNDYTEYMNVQQQINLAIYKDFEQQGIEFAYPTQTLFLNKENGGSERQRSELVEN
jgi:small-conductance mechanosensitive channel